MANATFRELAEVLGWKVDDKVIIHLETKPMFAGEDVHHVYLVVQYNLKLDDEILGRPSV